jgi:hypothetical protein
MKIPSAPSKIGANKIIDLPGDAHQEQAIDQHTQSCPPGLGEYWFGQGGVNAGLVAALDDVPAHYLIIAKNDIGVRDWGSRHSKLSCTSKTNGLLNTQLLCDDDVEHPAASICAEYQSDGHKDFYLPAYTELRHCWTKVRTLLAEHTWYWSSTKSAGIFVFAPTSGQAIQYFPAKPHELSVRPVRRLYIFLADLPNNEPIYKRINEETAAEREIHINEISAIKHEITDLVEHLKSTEQGSAAANELQECIQFVHELLKGYIEMTAEEAGRAVETALTVLSEFVR